MQILSHRGFSAWITIGGEVLPVYQEETSGTTCSAWISSIAGQNFAVWWKDDSTARIATSGHVFIDGRDVASAIMRPGRSKPVMRMGAKTDDASLATLHDTNLNEMGTIRVKLGEEVPFKGYDVHDYGTVHEKAKRLGAHCTSYDPQRRSFSSRTVAVTTAPYDVANPGPYVTFLFRYRSEDFLRANGVICGRGNTGTSPPNDDEIIQILDSDDDNDQIAKAMPEEVVPPKKRPRVETDEGQVPRLATDLGGEVEPDCANVVTHIGDADMEDERLVFGTPLLLQPAESQTQAEDEDIPQ